MLSPPSDLRVIAARLPAEPILLMGAGPTPLPPEVAAANSLLISHLGPVMNGVIEAVQEMARYTFQTRAKHVIGIAGPASAAMEMAIANLVGPGSKVLCLVAGTFSRRLSEMAVGVGAEVTVLECAVGEAVTAEQVQAALQSRSFDLVTMVQGETSAGVFHAEIPQIAALVREHGALMMVDTVCTLSTMPLQMDDWGIDVVVTGGQKGLASIPGVSPIVFSDRAWAVVEARPRPMPHWCLDARRAWAFWGDHAYHYTAPVPGILAMHESLRLICEETLEVRHHRHRTCSLALQASLEAMGLTMFAAPRFRLNSVLAINRPQGCDVGRLKRFAEDVHQVELASAFGLDIFRIGQMGEQCRPTALRRTITAVGNGLVDQGLHVDVAAGLAALEEALLPLRNPIATP